MATDPPNTKPKSNPVSSTGTWQRLFLSLVGIVVVMIDWRWAVYHLYTLPTPALAGFVSLTTNVFYVVGAIVIFMVTGRLVYEWKLDTSQVQNVVSEAQNIIKDQLSGSSFDVESNVPIGNVNIGGDAPQEFISGQRSPKDFLGNDTSF